MIDAVIHNLLAAVRFGDFFWSDSRIFHNKIVGQPMLQRQPPLVKG